MSEDPPSLRVVAEDVLGEDAEAAALTPLSQLFYRVWSVLPDEQDIVDASPDESVGDALAKMAEHDYSQLPVRAGRQVLGVFSYKSFAKNVAEQVESIARTGVTELPVEALMSSGIFVLPYAELPELLDLLDSEEAVLVGDETGIDGVLTTVDVLRWLHDLAEPFVRLGEVEKSLREIVARTLTAEQIAGCATQTFRSNYRGREDKLPTRLGDMAFDELRLLVIDGRNWPLLVPALGHNIEMVKAKLKLLPSLRNDVFHFRRDLEEADLGAIRTARQWLLNRLRMVEMAADD